jgi:hypothetical protein
LGKLIPNDLIDLAHSFEAHAALRKQVELLATASPALEHLRLTEELNRRHELYRGTFETINRHSELYRSVFEDLNRQQGLYRSTFEEVNRQNELYRSTLNSFDEVQRLCSMFETSHVAEMRGLTEAAFEAAERISAFSMPPALESWRMLTVPLVERLLLSSSHNLWGNEAYLKTFSETAAFSNVLSQSARITSAVDEAASALLATNISFDNLAQYRNLLDSAGLYLSRWPRLRRLTEREKRRRLKARLLGNAEPPPVRRAKSIVHRYELTLREVLDEAMSMKYGDEWAEQRLPECGCKDLIGKWKKLGGTPLEHADYFHYAQIVSHPEHFAAIFAGGFDDALQAHRLFVRAGQLRAASHHAREFTTNDLRELRVIWRTIERALAALSDDFIIES